MHATLLALVLSIPGASAGRQDSWAFCGHCPAAAIHCPHDTPPVRCFRKPCAGCAGGVCLSCQQPYFGSAPYNYRVQFDYPWSQQPAYPFGCYESGQAMGEAAFTEPPLMGPNARKARTALKR